MYITYTAVLIVCAGKKKRDGLEIERNLNKKLEIKHNGDISHCLSSTEI